MESEINKTINNRLRIRVLHNSRCHKHGMQETKLKVCVEREHRDGQAGGDKI